MADVIAGVAGLVGWAAWTCGFLAAAEYFAHRYVMHRPPRTRLGRRLFGDFFWNHAVEHHRNGRNDVSISFGYRYHMAGLAPLLALLAWLGCPGAAAVVAGLTAAYVHTWDSTHRAIHGAGGDWARRLPWYAHLRDHHLAHHDRVLTNYAGVFTPIDHVMGTTHG